MGVLELAEGFCCGGQEFEKHSCGVVGFLEAFGGIGS
jgi:hypothetical protein